MQKLTKVNIGGREYSLRGEDEQLIYNAASEVNLQLDEIKGKTNEPQVIQSVLAALNIAEKYYTNKKQIEIDLKFLTNEIDNMNKVLSEPLNLAKQSINT